MGWPTPFSQFLFSTSATRLPAGFVVYHCQWKAPLREHGGFRGLPNTTAAARKDGVGVAGGVNKNWLNVADHPHAGFAPKSLLARNKAAAQNARYAPLAANRLVGRLVDDRTGECSCCGRSG